ncbi:MAG: DUF1707 SHOCT-like domain-containing protein [Pseudonocardiaceae bacterium]
MVESAGDEDIRASDADRDRVAAELAAAVGAGRLTLEEYSDRVARVYAARTGGELGRLVADLPAVNASPVLAAPVRSGGTEWLVTPIGGLRRRGRWRLARRTVYFTAVGGMRLDLGQVELSGPDATVIAVLLVGGARITVPAGVAVQLSGLTLLGGRRVEVDDNPMPDAPVLRLRVFTLVGGVRITRE